MTQSIEALARAAIEAAHGDDEHASNEAYSDFGRAATPQAILALTARNRELERELALLGPVCTPIQDQPSEGRTTMPVETYRAMTARIAELEKALRQIDAHNDRPARYNSDINAVISRALSQKPSHPVE